MARQKILVLEDSESIRSAVSGFLEAAGYQVTACDSCARALEECAAQRFDAAVADYLLPDGTALELLPRLREMGVQVPLVVLTGHGSVDLAVRAMKEGAEHFLTKPVELPALLAVLRRIDASQRALRKEVAAKTHGDRLAADPFLGQSAAIKRLAEEAAAIKGSDSPILIQGETGSGKGVLAAWLHANGPRADESFVDLNCAGLSPQFLETELFGHERGAFTGAVLAKAGLFEIAHRGTLFLDEIGDIDPAVQPKLLKALEEQRFRRLGEVRDRVVDVRLIAASHMDLSQLVAERRFRSDLYFRISALPLRVPPLRERREDVPAMARRLLEKIAADLGRPELRINTAGEEALKAQPWPGNVRELRNVLERAALLAGKDELDFAGLHFAAAGAEAQAGDASVSLKENERRHLQRVLQHCEGRVGEAAKILGISRSAVYDRLKRHGLAPSGS